VWVLLGERRWPYWADETTAAQARNVRDQTGHSRGWWLKDIIETDGTEVDSWTVLWWMTRMQCGEPNLTFSECESVIKYGDDFRIEPGRSVDLGDEDESPES